MIGVIIGFLCFQRMPAQVSSPRLPTDLFTYWSKAIPGNITEPIFTGLSVQTGDYVYIEVHGQIKVGNYLGNANGVELIKPPFFSLPSNYSKYPGKELGAVIVGIGNQQIACGRMFRFGNHPIYHAMVDKDRLIVDRANEAYVPGVYFLASTGGVLTLDVNDSITTDNEGQYTVEVFLMRHANHLQRNKFNVCPAQEPTNDLACSRRDNWRKESKKSAYYHGIMNTSYRGSSRFAGCQCVYDSEGSLLSYGKNIGSFDIGFWIGKSDESDPAATHRHLILDVLPHDLYENDSGVNNYAGQTTYSCR